MTVVGWSDAYGNAVPTVTFTAERKKALVERIRKRRYNFNHFSEFSDIIIDDGVKNWCYQSALLFRH